MNRQPGGIQNLRMKLSGQKPSRALDEFIRSIGDCKSKIDEDRIMVREEQNLREVFGSTANLKGRDLEEALVRAMYLNILNYDSDFALIPALNGLASRDLKTKRLCYLAISLFIQPDSSELLLLVNSIQKDLTDDNYLVKWTALSALTTMISLELVPAILPQVSKCLSHPKELVRKKAVLALQRFIQLDNNALNNPMEGVTTSVLEGQGISQMLRTALCDKDPSVMGASLNAFYEVAKVDIENYRNLVPSFVSILKQVVERRLPRTYEYKKHPSPWMQIKLLKLISCLCAGDRGASENAYAILAETMKAANTGTPIGTAIMYECVLTIANIFPNTSLLSQVENLLDPWVKSHSINLKHAFLRAQIQLSKVNPDFSKKHQRAVVEFMEYPDSTLRWMSFLLLCEITRTHNVTTILPHLDGFCEQITDERMRLDLANRIYELAEKYAPDFQFFVGAALEVFRVLGECSEVQAASQGHTNRRNKFHGLKQIDTKQLELVQRFVASFKDQPKEVIPEALVLCTDALLEQGIRATVTLATAAVILVGQYGHLNSMPVTDLMDRLCDTYIGTTDENVRRQIIHSLFTLSTQSNTALTPGAQKVVQKATLSKDWVAQQLAIQTQALLAQQQFGSPIDMLFAIDPDQVDENLGFLEVYVQSAVANGAKPYIFPEDRVFGEEEQFSYSTTQKLKTDAYEYPTQPIPAPNTSPIPQPATAQQEPALLNFDGMMTDGVQTAPTAAPVQVAQPQPQQPAPQADPFQLNIRTTKWGAQKPREPQPVQQQQADLLFDTSTTSQTQVPQVEQQVQQVQQEEEELDEKGLLAQSLFGGVPSKTTNLRRPRTSPRPQALSQKSQSSAPDLLAFDSSTHQAQQKPQGGLDLLDFSMDGSTQQNTNQSQQVQQGMNLLDDFGASQQPQSTVDPFLSLQQTQQASGSGMFMGMQGTTSNGTQSAPTPKKGPNAKSNDPFADLLM